MQIIFKHICTIDGILTGTTTPGQSNANGGVLNIPMTSRTEASLLDAIECHY